MWHSRTGEYKLALAGHSGKVLSAVFSADDSAILTASEDQTARIWDRSTGECKQTFIGHTDMVNSAFFSPD